MRRMAGEEDQSPSKIKDKMYDIEVEDQAVNANPVNPPNINPRTQATMNLAQEQHLDDIPEFEAGRR